MNPLVRKHIIATSAAAAATMLGISLSSMVAALYPLYLGASPAVAGTLSCLVFLLSLPVAAMVYGFMWRMPDLLTDAPALAVFVFSFLYSFLSCFLFLALSGYYYLARVRHRSGAVSLQQLATSELVKLIHHYR